jgi:hypothetical protein
MPGDSSTAGTNHTSAPELMQASRLIIPTSTMVVPDDSAAPTKAPLRGKNRKRVPSKDLLQKDSQAASPVTNPFSSIDFGSILQDKP